MKYRIVEIAEIDAFHSDRHSLVGKIIETDPTYGDLDIDRSPFVGGRFLICDDITFDNGETFTKENPETIFFYAVHLEPVQENN